MFYVKLLISAIAGLLIGALVAFLVLFLCVLGYKFFDWLAKKFDL